MNNVENYTKTISCPKYILFSSSQVRWPICWLCGTSCKISCSSAAHFQFSCNQNKIDISMLTSRKKTNNTTCKYLICAYQYFHFAIAPAHPICFSIRTYSFVGYLQAICPETDMIFRVIPQHDVILSKGGPSSQMNLEHNHRGARWLYKPRQPNYKP